MITRRDLVIALVAVATTVGFVQVISASRAETPVMQSALFDGPQSFQANGCRCCAPVFPSAR